MVKRVGPSEAKDLLGSGWAYVDVRTEAEFAAGHPEGAYNVPIGSDFLPAMQRLFGDKGAKVIVGCQAGGRSARAAAALEQTGWTNVVDQGGGWGEWSAAGLPTERDAKPGRSWKDIASKR